MQPTFGMFSKARVLGHPIHPMVVVFPIALFTSTVATLLAFIATGDSFYFRAAMVACTAGVTMALLAAIPGAIDLFSLPKGSPARAAGMKHASLALLTVGLFAATAALLYRSWLAETLDATVPLAIGVLGMVTLVIVGALGWALVQTHHVGIEPEIVRMREPPITIAEDDLDDDLPGISAPRPYTEHVVRH